MDILFERYKEAYIRNNIQQEEKLPHHKKPKRNIQIKSLFNHLFKKLNNILQKEKLLHHKKLKKSTQERRLFNLLLKMLFNQFISKLNQFFKKVLNQLYSKDKKLNQQLTKEHKILM